MGFSIFFSSFCKKTLAIMCYEAKENNMKFFSKLGLANTGALVNATLMSSKYFMALGIHFISFPFLSMLVICFMILSKLGINLLKKFTFPRKYCTYFLLLGMPIFKIPSTLLGSTFIPSFEIMWLDKFPSSMEKFHFLGFNEIPKFLHL
jgi:hypothetical protein